MYLDKYYFITVISFGLLLKAAANDAPLLRESRSSIVLPSVFIIEETDGVGLSPSGLIKTTNKYYYTEICELLKSEIASRITNGIDANQAEHTLSLIELDLKREILPRWVENIFIVCKESEVMVSFFARNGGWTETNTGTLGMYSNPAYICTIDPKTGKVLSTANKLRATIYANLYHALADGGLVTDYTQRSGFITPLNPSKTSKIPKGKTSEDADR
jgi:hypothetical protein